MPSSCVVGGCTHRKGQFSKRRDFLIFHIAPADHVRRAKWDLRVNRILGSVSKFRSYAVCSDHFHDSDYLVGDFRVYQEMGYISRMRLRLKQEAVPNTHPERDICQLFIDGSLVAEDRTGLYCRSGIKWAIVTVKKC